jgi:uncharacterized protein YceK
MLKCVNRVPTSFMSKIYIVLMLTMTICGSGCASILKGSNDTVSIHSIEPGTVIYVDGSARGRDSVNVDLRRGESHVIRVSKPGCHDVTVPTTDSFDATSLLGIFIDFGIVSIPVDLVSGNAWKVSPRSYTASPICKM